MWKVFFILFYLYYVLIEVEFVKRFWYYCCNLKYVCKYLYYDVYEDGNKNKLMCVLLFYGYTIDNYI